MRALDYSIGELSAETGVKVPTIRYYEGIGLIPAPPRTEGNQRRYDGGALDRLRFIAHARAMGFPMESLRAMLQIAGHKDAPCDDLDALVRDRLVEVDDRIARLTALRTELSAMLDSHHHGTVGECRVIEVLSDPSRLADRASLGSIGQSDEEDHRLADRAPSIGQDGDGDHRGHEH